MPQPRHSTLSVRPDARDHHGLFIVQPRMSPQINREPANQRRQAAFGLTPARLSASRWRT